MAKQEIQQASMPKERNKRGCEGERCLSQVSWGRVPLVARQGSGVEIRTAEKPQGDGDGALLI